MKYCIICKKPILHNYTGRGGETQRTCGETECQSKYEKLKVRIWHKASRKLKERHRGEFLVIFRSLLDEKQKWHHKNRKIEIKS